MVLLLTDVFLLLTQVFLWLIVGLVTWFVLFKTLPRAFLSLLVLFLILGILVLSFFRGPPVDGGILETLWRIISFPFTPWGLGVVLLLMLFTGVKFTKFARRAALVALALLALGSVPFIAYSLARELEFEAVELIQPQPALTVPGSRRVIVVLAQDTTRPQLRVPQQGPPTSPPKSERPISLDAFQILSQLPIQLTEKGDRLIYAAQLYQNEVRAGTNPLITLSASRQVGRRAKDEPKEDISEARVAQRFLTQTLNIPESAILLDHDGTGVHTSAERVRQLLDSQKINYGNQITLVTSALSMNRALLTFAQVFDEARIYARPTDFYTLPPSNTLVRAAQGRDLVEQDVQVTDFLPNAQAFCLSSETIEEYLNALYYFLRGWIRPFRGIRS